MSSKYIDTISTIQVIGSCFNNPSLLDFTDKYVITDEDFPNEFHKIAFGAIYKLHELGVEKISIENICDFLSSRPKSEAVFKQNKGEEWLLKISENSMSSAFDYYYNRLKKFTLLRAYDNYGINVTDIYDPDNILDKGYSLVIKDGKIVKDISNINIKDDIDIMVKNGKINAEVKGVSKNE